MKSVPSHLTPNFADSEKKHAKKRHLLSPGLPHNNQPAQKVLESIFIDHHPADDRHFADLPGNNKTDEHDRQRYSCALLPR